MITSGALRQGERGQRLCVALQLRSLVGACESLLPKAGEASCSGEVVRAHGRWRPAARKAALTGLVVRGTPPVAVSRLDARVTAKGGGRFKSRDGEKADLASAWTEMTARPGAKKTNVPLTGARVVTGEHSACDDAPVHWKSSMSPVYGFVWPGE